MVSGTSSPGDSSAIRPVRSSSVSGTCCGPRPAAHSVLPNVFRNTGVDGTTSPSDVSTRTSPMSTRSVCVESLRIVPVSTRSPGIVGCVNSCVSPAQPIGPELVAPSPAIAITTSSAAVASTIMNTARRVRASARVWDGAVLMIVLIAVPPVG
jgi:hypothetical protein